MSRYSDPRRPTSNGPKLVDAGKIVMKRESAGRYVHTTRYASRRCREYEVVQIENGSWVWAEVGKQANDSFQTKRAACAALLAYVYGDDVGTDFTHYAY